jgi:hypothetical protein
MKEGSQGVSPREALKKMPYLAAQDFLRVATEELGTALRRQALMVRSNWRGFLCSGIVRPP